MGGPAGMFAAASSIVQNRVRKVHLTYLYMKDSDKAVPRSFVRTNINNIPQDTLPRQLKGRRIRGMSKNKQVQKEWRCQPDDEKIKLNL